MKFLHKTQLLFIHFRNNERVHPRKHATDAIRWISSDNPAKIFHYKITKIVRELWLAERSVCMRVCKHGCDLKMFCFSKANHASTNLKSFWVQNLTNLLYLPIPSSAENWKIFTNKLCQFCFCAKSKTSSGLLVYIQTRTWYISEDNTLSCEIVLKISHLL